MVHAYVLVKTAPGRSDPAIDKIRAIGEIVEAHIVAGEYDIVAEVDAGDVYHVLQTASSNIQSLEGIETTRTYIALQ